jgi:hypothetical protein
MTTGTGIDAQLTIGEEEGYGVPVTTTRGFEFEQEAIQAQTLKVYGKSLRQLRHQRKDRVRTYVQGAKGTIQFEVLSKGFGVFFRYMLGKVVSSQPDSVLKPTEYMHLFTEDDTAIFGKSLTVQVGRPAVNGTIVPFTYSGVKVTDWSMDTKVGDTLNLQLTVDAKSEDTAAALATPTYPTNAALLDFVDGTVTVDGTTSYVTALTVAGKMGLNVARWGIGNVKREPVPNAEAAITGTFTSEFEGLALHTKMLAGTTVALVLNFSYGEIDAGQANPYMVKISIPNAEITGDPPVVGGPATVPHNLKFKALDDGTLAPISIEYHTTDITP